MTERVAAFAGRSPVGVRFDLYLTIPGEEQVRPAPPLLWLHDL